MQPYFMPYAGYFRLLAATELFVVYERVQFPRRGWVPRNKLADAHGQPQWLTMPLASAEVDTAICDLRFRSGAREDLQPSVPRRGVCLKELPKNQNGKADRQELAGIAASSSR
jgi:hypothetical protein